MEQLQAVAEANKFQAVAFQRFGWTDGVYYSSWGPIIPGKKNHFEGPADLWRSIAQNNTQSRIAGRFDSNERPAELAIAEILDEKGPVEALADYISLSLRAMDISVEEIAEHYHEQLVNHMAAGRVDAERSADTLSKTLYAHVHSFFLHLGAARDYLAALVACRVSLDPAKTDSMAKLVDKLQQERLPDDALLNLLFSSENIAAHAHKKGKYSTAGWIKEVTDIRNELIHRRPYGSRFVERWGCAIPSQENAGLFRYYRPMRLNASAEHDVFDVLHRHYARCADLFYRAAKASGYNTAMMHITDKDVISLDTENATKPDD
ncbi:hypothetical protein [Rhodobacter sp. CZR27]|uniref:hypothetical protein n=1 Tax=Rhodobacter sp. CZR27 TaxID=2033869 RepID=UPI0012FE5559|nr:hypothetical protein [Rhodobacter sp. CZR27]